MVARLALGENNLLKITASVNQLTEAVDRFPSTNQTITGNWVFTQNLTLGAGLFPGISSFHPGGLTGAQIYTDAVRGLVIYGQTGSSFDFGFFSASGGELFTNATGTNNVKLLSAGGGLSVGAGCTIANGTVATSLTSVGPSGASTTVQEWLTFKNNAGTTRYVPCF